MATGEVDSTPIFPHEDIPMFRERIAEGNPDRIYEFRTWAGWLSMQKSGNLDPVIREQASATANGPIGADIFSDKYQFGAFIRDMGYTAPESVIVEPNDVAKQVGAVDNLDNSSPQRFCKPWYGTRGIGAFLAGTPQEALEFVAEQDVPYLVQSYEKPLQDWRHIYHRDAVDVVEGTPPTWRIAIQKVRPQVVGDGELTIGELVASHEEMTEKSKRIYTKTHEEALGHIPQEGEVVNLVQAGNQSQGAYPTYGTLTERRNLDRFMTHFLEDAERQLGAKLATVCVDLGVKKEGLLSGEFDLETYKKEIVFYEHQMPFGTMLRIPKTVSWGPLDKLVPPKYRNEYVKAQIYSNLMRSVIRSGRLLHAAGVVQTNTSNA